MQQATKGRLSFIDAPATSFVKVAELESGASRAAGQALDAWGAAGAARWPGNNFGRGVLGVHAMSQHEVVWILLGAALIAAAGVGAFVVAIYALSPF